ncbi:MAG: hypothetical protein IJ228_05610 [Succinivibrio sp.]|nr:hypothetical protein [Succinivibrio sp.]
MSDSISSVHNIGNNLNIDPDLNEGARAVQKEQADGPLPKELAHAKKSSGKSWLSCTLQTSST